MQIVARCTVKLDAPLHIYTPMSRSMLCDGDPMDKTGVFIGPDWPIVEARTDGVLVRLTLKPDLVVNPLLTGHHAHGVPELLAKAVVEVESFTPTDTTSYEQLCQRLNRGLLETSNRLVDFFRFRLGNPLLKRLNYGAKSRWTFFDESGNVLHEEAGFLIVHHFPGLPGTKYALGSKALRPSELPELVDYVASPTAPSTTLALLAQARDAVLSSDINLAVILLAVCAEVAIKTAYFRRDPVVSEAYDYLEEKRQVEVSPIELITQVAKRAFGSSFRDSAPEASQAIEYLFRCRNKVAHRGQAIYRDQSGTLRTPDEDTLLLWWQSVDDLLSWLESCTAAKPI
jgi:hypothetical protein